MTQPPHDHGAERVVLGAMMLSPSAAAKAAEILSVQDFYRPAHSIVFAAITDAVLGREPSDPVAIAARLTESGELSRAGGAPGLHDLVAAVPVAASVAHYARIVSDRARMRSLIDAGAKITQLGADLDRDPGDAAALAAKVLADATTVKATTSLVPIGEALSGALDAIEAASSGGAIPGLPTGMPKLDEVMGGLRPGQLIVVAGRPGMGKSIIGVEWARHAAIGLGKAVAVFSLEMSRNEVINRVIAAQASIPIAAITNGRLSQRDWDTVATASGRISHAPLFIDDSAPLSLADLFARARRLHAQNPLSLVFVDYLQLMTLGRRTENRQQEVADISRGLKLLAKELQCPVVAAAQLNRGVESRQDKRPHLSDLRESGAVEQDSDAVILLYREQYYDQKTKRGNEIDLILAKHRNGPTGHIVAFADFEYARLKSGQVTT